MAKVEITESLYAEIIKRFKEESVKILEHLRSLEKSPKKGKILGTVGGIVIKEVKHRGFRFYFLADGFKLKFIDEASLTDLLLRFVRMSDKKQQKKVIKDIKHVLKTIGPRGF